MASLPKSGLELSDFEGKWTLSRVISDLRAGVEGVLSGEAVFRRQDDETLLYEETGTLSYASQPPVAATRRYVWRAVEEGIAVMFEDGRPFHTIALDRSMPDANHHCDPDLYHVSYDFTRWPKWRSSWRVVGPRKDYRMVSDFVRSDAA